MSHRQRKGWAVIGRAGTGSERVCETCPGKVEMADNLCVGCALEVSVADQIAK